MVAKPIVLSVTLVMVIMVALPFVSLDDMSADSMMHVTFYDSDGNVLQESDWTYRTVPYCVESPSAPEGMRFVGWSTISGSDAVMDILPVESDIGYHPVYLPTDSVYGVTFDPENGIDEPRVMYHAKDSIVTIPTLDALGFSTKYDHGPFILDTWMPESGLEQDVGSTFILSSDTMLVAEWIRSVAVTPEFDNDLPSSISIDRFDDYTLSVSCTCVDGDSLTYEWFLRGVSEDTSLGIGSIFHIPDTIASFPGTYIVYVRATNLDRSAVVDMSYADSNMCSITVDATYLLSIHGTDTISEHHAGDSVGITFPFKEGHVLVDLLLPDGTSVFDDDFLIMPSYDVTLKPVWEKDVCRIEYRSEGSVTDVMDVTYGELISLSAGPIRGGYGFSGWTCRGNTFDACTNVCVTSDMVFEACWVPNVPSCMVDGVRYEGDSVVLGSEGVLYWYDQNGIRYLPGETVAVEDGQSFLPIRS